MSMEKIKRQRQKTPKKKDGGKRILLAAVGIAVIVLAVFIAVPLLFKGSKADRTSVITVSTLEKIVNTSELSTFTAVYNGIAKVMNEKKPEEVDYYVSYEATVEAGIDLDQVNITMDAETKTVTVTIPGVRITDSTVDIHTMDFIFYNDKANTSSVTQEAYAACEADVDEETKTHEAILDLANQNAVNVVKALLAPFIEQAGSDYSLVVE